MTQIEWINLEEFMCRSERRRTYEELLQFLTRVEETDLFRERRLNASICLAPGSVYVAMTKQLTAVLLEGLP